MDWEQILSISSPSARADHAMAYDSARAKTVLFGGYDVDDIYSDETWEWDGTKWEEITPSVSPVGRMYHAMVYDIARSKTVLYGGFISSNNDSSDTWEWDGESWEQLSSVTIPKARGRHAMAYDSTRDKIVLFGGMDLPGYEYADTWEWEMASLQPGQTMHVTCSVADLVNSATIDEMKVRFVSGADSQIDTGRIAVDGGPCDPPTTVCKPDYQPDEGATMMLWKAGQWEPIASNSRNHENPGLIEWSIRDSSKYTPLFFQNTLNIAIVPHGVNGTEKAALSTDYAEVKVRYCLGEQSECDSSAFPGNEICFDGGSCEVGVDVSANINLSRRIDTIQFAQNTQSSSCGNTTTGELVYRLISEQSGTMVVSTDHGHTDFNTVLSSRSDCCDSSTELICNDDIDVINDRSEISFEVVAGETYYVILEGAGEDVGSKAEVSFILL